MAHWLPTTRARHSPEGIEPEPIRISLLGGFGALVGSRTIEGNEWRLRKAESLVKLLALAKGHRLHRELIMDSLWSNLDKKSQANNLNRALHFARRVLDAGAASRHLTLREGMISLCPKGQLRVDVEVFENAATTARRSREPSAYRKAVELYAGELLPEDAYEAWAEEKREDLRRLYRSLLVELAGLYEQRGEYGPTIEALRRVVAEESTHEEAHANLMYLYVLCGRRDTQAVQAAP